MVHQQYNSNATSTANNGKMPEGVHPLTDKAIGPNLIPARAKDSEFGDASGVRGLSAGVTSVEGVTSFQSPQTMPFLGAGPTTPNTIKKKPPAPLPKPDPKKIKTGNLIKDNMHNSATNLSSETPKKKDDVLFRQQLSSALDLKFASSLQDISSNSVVNQNFLQQTRAEITNPFPSQNEEVVTKFPNSFVATRKKKSLQKPALGSHSYQPSIASNSSDSSGECSSRASVIFETDEDVTSFQTFETTEPNHLFQFNRSLGHLLSRSSTSSSSSFSSNSSKSSFSSKSSVYSGTSPVLSKTFSGLSSGLSSLLASPSTSSLSSSSSRGISSLDVSSASLVLPEGRCVISIPEVPEYDEVNASSCDKCSEELPVGWEKVEDPHYGVYYIDHVNRRTQYENPSNTVKATADTYTGEEVTNTFPRPKKVADAAAKRSASENNMQGPLQSPNGRLFFTNDPEELKGEFTQTSLVKSARGLGFTIIGGNQRNTQFLQIKNVVENGPAFISGKFRSGDVIVRVNNTCVLGFTHQDVVRLFQSIAPGETVYLEICRGYPLNFDPDDPNQEIVTTVAVSSPHYGNQTNGQFSQNGTLDYGNTHSMQMGLKSLPDLTRTAVGQVHSSTLNLSSSNGHHDEAGMPSMLNQDDTVPDLVSLSIHGRPEVLTIPIVKGPMGFGFTIADSPYGQRVKQILDQTRCKNLAEGDLLLLINSVNVLELPHQQTVQFLKDCKQDQETVIVVQRRGIPPPSKGKKHILLSRSFEEQQGANSGAPPGAYFSSHQSRSFEEQQAANSGAPPGAYFFSNQDQNFNEQLRDNFPSNNVARSDLENGCISSSALPPPIEEADEETDDADGAKQPTKTVPQETQRPKTPLDVNRAKLPPNKIGSPKQQGYMDMNVGRRDYQDLNDFNKFNSSHPRADVEGNSMGRPPRGPSRPDFFPRFDPRLRNGDSRTDPFQRSMLAMHGGEERWTHGRDVKPGQFRSRTPGPELMTRGPDAGRLDPHRPKTPTAADMRSNGKSMTSFGTGDFKTSGRFTPNPSSEQGRQYRSPYQDARNWPEMASHPNYDSFDNPSLNRNYAGEFPRPAFQNSVGPGRPIRQSTSFESDKPAPSTITRLPRKPPPHPAFQGHSQMSQNRIVTDENGVQVMEMLVTLYRQESGYGFRIIGGTEESSQVSVGHIVPGGAADLDGRIRQNDEITHVDGCSVLSASHHRVVELMTNAALNGTVTLSIKRVLGPDTKTNEAIIPQYPYDVVVSRRENEGFGFVIISSVTKAGASVDEFIGHIQDNSPAARCGRLHIGDRILAVNGVDTSNMHHKDVVSIIKDSGFSVALTIGPPPGPDDASNLLQKSSGANTTNYPADKLDMNIQSWERNQPGMSRELGRPRLLSSKSSDENEELYQVELNRGSRGFGFSIRGGREFNAMPLYVLRIAEGGAADVDGRLRVGDQILEINSFGTESMTHTDAIEIIQNGGLSVKLLMRRTNKPPPVFEGPPASPSNMSQGGPFFPNIPPVVNGPISHSSPHMARRQLQQHQQPLPLPPPPPELQLPNNDYFHNCPPPPSAAQSSLPRQRLNNY